MVYCQECGSEIAEVDTFCPFCGISIHPIKISNDSELDQDSTGEEEILTTSDVKDLTNKPVEEKSDSLNDSEEDVIDLSETIAFDQSSDSPFESDQQDSGYIDISMLKDEEDEEIPDSTEGFAEESEKVSEDLSPDENVNQIIDDKVDSVNDNFSSSEVDSDNLTGDDSVDSKIGLNDALDGSQDPLPLDEKLESGTAPDIEQSEELSDDKIESKIEDEPQSPNPQVVETVDRSEAIISDLSLAETNEDSPKDDDQDAFSSKKRADDFSRDLAKEQKLNETDIPTPGFLDANQENGPTGIETPPEIKDVKDSEIEDAVSAIDAKAQVWKKEDTDVTDSPMDVIEEPEAPVAEKKVEPETDSVSEVEMSGSMEIVTNSSENQIHEESEYSQSSQSSGSDAKIETSTEKESTQDESHQTTPNIGKVDTDGSSSSKLKPLDEGVVLNGRYEIVRKIGGGGMGAVYLANDKNLGGVLRAVKEMVQSYIEEEQQEKAINDFKRESLLLTSLEHPSIPTIYDYFYDAKEARFYLVMKYISGGDLSARLRAAPEGKLDEVSVTDWAYQIADVLEYLHTREPVIVYRDLKPANIMIDGNTNKVMLIDFGIARCINKEEKGVTAVGTMGYAPPELFSGNVQPSSDIYSLGSTMFHLLTGADPQSNPLLIFDFQKHPYPRQINPQLSDQMERILMKAVEYNAEKRFSSAAEMRNALGEHLHNLKVGNVSFGIKESPTSVALSDQPVFCGFCGQKIVATDMFCAFCGAKQPLAQPGIHSQEYHIPQTTAKLIIQGTSELDYPSFELVKDDNLVGRRDPMSNIFPEVDLSKYDPQTKISRKHARIWREGDVFMVEDLGSSNGTLWIPVKSEVSKLIPKQAQVLTNGDKIQVGDTTLQFIAE